MTKRKFAGAFILLSFFAVLFGVTVAERSLSEALIIWGGSIIGTGIIGFGIHLLIDDAPKT